MELKPFQIRKELKHFNGTVEKFECDICEKDFQSRSKLKCHLEKIHKIKRYDCNICFKQFANNGRLRQHMKSIHVKEIRIMTNQGIRCELCDKLCTL